MSEQVLGLPELLAAIFSFVDRKTNFQNALVCRTWSDVALGEIWRNLDKLHVFLNLLAPLTLERHESKVFEHHLFSRVPTDADWHRVARYSSLVRKLDYQKVPGAYPLSPQIFTDIAQTKPHNIFPHLHTLVWNPPNVLITLGSMWTSLAFLFLHSGVTSISITLPRILAPESHGPVIGKIATYAPNLGDLILIPTSRPASIETDLCTLIPALPKLRCITLPREFSTNRIFNTCSRLPALHSLNFGFGIPTLLFQKSTSQPLLPDMSPDAFPALEVFSLIADFSDVMAAFNALPVPQNLKYLEFGSRNVAVEDIACLIRRVSDPCKALRGFTFSSKTLLRRRGIDEITPPIDFQMLKPLTSIPLLGVLLLDHDTPLALSLGDIDSLLSELPYLVRLTLNIAPVYYKESLLGLDVLGIAGNRCRNLMDLGVFVDATLPVASLTLKDAPRIPIFANLRTLRVGISIITKETTHSTALLLAQVLPMNCTLDYGGYNSSQGRRPPGELYSVINARVDLWEEVERLLGLFREARLYERTAPPM